MQVGMRADAALAADYAALKRALAQEHAGDPRAYAEAKGPFIRRALGPFLDKIEGPGRGPV